MVVFGNYAFGIVLLSIVVFLWITSSVITQSIFISQHFDYPFFLTTFSTSVFTMYIPYHCIRISRSSTRSLDKPQASWKEVMRNAIILCPVWFVMNFSFNTSLSMTSVASNTIMSSTSSLFTLLIEAYFLNTIITPMNVLGVLCTIAGAVLVALPDISSGHGGSTGTYPLLGDSLALLSAVLYGVYSVLLQTRLKGSDVPMTMLFGCMGLINVLLFGPVAIVLYISGVEPLSGLSLNVALSLLGNGVISALADTLWATAVLLTSPLVATIGISLTIPLAVLADVLFLHRTFQPVYVGGGICVLLGFLFVNFRTSSISSTIDGEMAEDAVLLSLED